MTNKEAIETLKANYPDACYSQLREAVNKAIEVLEEPRDSKENELKFYYVALIDEYCIGQRRGNFYYAKWDNRLGFVWSYSRYLPWGKCIIDENTLRKEYTYSPEPVEIPFTKWIVGFMTKYSAEMYRMLDKNSR